MYDINVCFAMYQIGPSLDQIFDATLTYFNFISITELNRTNRFN